MRRCMGMEEWMGMSGNDTPEEGRALYCSMPGMTPG